MTSPLPPRIRARIRRALRAGVKPLDVARRLNLPLLTIAAFLTEHGWIAPAN